MGKIINAAGFGFGYMMIAIGMLLCFTIIGAVFGIPMMLYGFFLIYVAYKEQSAEKQRSDLKASEVENAEKTRKAIADGIAEGLRKAREAEVASNTIPTNEINK